MGRPMYGNTGLALAGDSLYEDGEGNQKWKLRRKRAKKHPCNVVLLVCYLSKDLKLFALVHLISGFVICGSGKVLVEWGRRSSVVVEG